MTIAVSLRRCVAVILLAVLGGCGVLSAAPTDNPVASLYSGPEGYPAWTDDIKWANVIDMKAYAKGANDFQKFENARDELAAKGGGVLYYPAGTYDFTDIAMTAPIGRGLMLRSGVVIRGEAPKGKPVAARDGRLDLGTKFVFGLALRAAKLGEQDIRVEVPRPWNIVGLMPEAGKGVSTVDRVGICWVHLTGAVIYFGPEMVWADTWKAGKSWKSANVKAAWADRKPDGTHPYDPFMGAPGPKDGGKYVGAGNGRLVFGCVLEKAALTNDFETCGRKEAPEGFGERGFHMAKFTGRIGAYGSNVCVANNYLPEVKDGNFLYTQTTVQTMPRKGNDFAIGKPRQSTIMWDYNRVMGIDVNKDMLSMDQDALRVPGERGYFEPGLVVVDNWVFNHGHRGFNLSGQWGTICRNRNERTFLKGGEAQYDLPAGWVLTLDGFIEASPGGGGMISDNLARPFDMAGRNLWMGNNTWNNTGSSPGNDGEGICWQLHGGTGWYSSSCTRNEHTGGTGGNNQSFIGPWALPAFGVFLAWNKVPGFVGMQYSKQEVADMTFVANQGKTSSGHAKATTQSVGKLVAPTGLKVALTADRAVRIDWTDASDNEIGFRVDRRLDGGKWYPIAYRPARIEGHALNPQAWVDYLLPPGKPASYRVVAVNADDSDEGASQASDPVAIK